MHNHSFNIEPEKIDQIIKHQAMRRAITQACHFWFFHLYFPHYIKYKSADFHKELFELTENQAPGTVVIEAFRGSGKTTIMGTSYAIWSILGCQGKKFVLIIAKTESQARQYLANIKMELEANSLLRSDLGPFEEPDDEWRAVSIVLPKYDARITVASIDKSVRGIKHGQHRPDLIIADDLEDLDTVRTQEGRDKVYNWLMGDIIPLGDKNTRMIVIGTRLHNDSIIMRLKKAILDGTMLGVSRSYPFLNEQGETIWPDKYTTQVEINILKKSLPSPQAWEREFMLRIIADDDQVIRPEWIQYYDDIPQDTTTNFRYIATGVDPAISEKETADYTAMVSGRVYGRKNSLKILILPNPVNERMDFPKTLTTIKATSRALGNGIPTKVWIEGVAYQKSLIDQLKAEGWPVKEYRPQGSDKRARLSLVSSLIQSGKVLFPHNGAERLISQITGFGTERHDDLSDAFCILVLSILGQESFTIKGYYPLFSDEQTDVAYMEAAPLLGEKRLGVVLAGGSSNYSTIVLRAENAAQVLYHETTNDVMIVTTKIIELAKEYNIPVANRYIFIDSSGRSLDLCNRLKECAVGQFDSTKYGYYQHYGVDLNQDTIGEASRFVNVRARSYWRLMDWLKDNGKLFGRPIFDDLWYLAYADQDGRIKMIDRDRLVEEGVDSSIPEALALTFVTDREREDLYVEEEEVELMYPEINV